MLSDETSHPSAKELTENPWTLRPIAIDDVDGLHTLANKPEVYRYLFDGSAPERPFVEHMVEKSLTDMNTNGVGMWVLQNQLVRYAGAVWVKPDRVTRSAELGYLLDPENWGLGLAIRMAWTAIKQAFSTSIIDCVFAGADRPNTRSFALMKRLGMRFRKDVTYPLGPGVEYVLHRDDSGPSPSPELLRICA